jgi:hypothetical protein
MSKEATFAMAWVVLLLAGCAAPQPQPQNYLEHWTEKNQKSGPNPGYGVPQHLTPLRIPEAPVSDSPRIRT